jgi:hypothetical protein
MAKPARGAKAVAVKSRLRVKTQQWSEAVNQQSRDCEGAVTYGTAPSQSRLCWLTVI